MLGAIWSSPDWFIGLNIAATGLWPANRSCRGNVLRETPGSALIRTIAMKNGHLSREKIFVNMPIIAEKIIAKTAPPRTFSKSIPSFSYVHCLEEFHTFPWDISPTVNRYDCIMAIIGSTRKNADRTLFIITQIRIAIAV